jgi:hypothetical protein
MNPFRHILISIFLILSGSWCYGQVKVTGHICAEVVESISVSCNNNPELAYLSKNVTKLDVGSFSISGAASATYNLIIDNANVRNESGDSYTIQTNTDGAEKSLIADLSGKHSLTLVAGTTELPANGQYQGNFGVTFAYN